MNTAINFVTFWQAQGLKKLGFNEGVTHFYDETGKLTLSSEEFEDEVFFDKPCVITVDSLMRDYNNMFRDGLIPLQSFSAPTLYQAQVWLMKNKNLLPEPHYFMNGKWFCVMRFLPDPVSVFNFVNNEGEYFYSYQEALSRGITSCLKFLGYYGED